MMSLNTEIIVLLDRSGSMEDVRSDTIGGFNTFIRSQREAPGRANLTLVQFDSVGIDTVYEGVPIKHVPGLILEPRGSTPLLDAIGQTINKTKHRLLKQRRSVDQVIFVIVTDGLENSSREFSKGRVLAMIEECKKELDWQFVYLGANQDAFAEGCKIGIKNAYTYIASPIHTQRLWDSVSFAIGDYRSSGTFYFSASAQAAVTSASAPGYVG